MDHYKLIPKIQFLVAIVCIPFFMTACVSNPLQKNSLVTYDTDIELTGVIRRETFPGRPNYENVRRGDEPETCWILHLERPINVVRDAELPSPEEGDFNASESNVSRLHLVIRDYGTYRGFVNQKIVARGKLWHGFNGHHHTDILMDVTDLSRR